MTNKLKNISRPTFIKWLDGYCNSIIKSSKNKKLINLTKDIQTICKKYNGTNDIDVVCEVDGYINGYREFNNPLSDTINTFITSIELSLDIVDDDIDNARLSPMTTPIKPKLPKFPTNPYDPSLYPVVTMYGINPTTQTNELNWDDSYLDELAKQLLSETDDGEYPPDIAEDASESDLE